jgi:hypothetical protein
MFATKPEDGRPASTERVSQVEVVVHQGDERLDSAFDFCLHSFPSPGFSCPSRVSPRQASRRGLRWPWTAISYRDRLTAEAVVSPRRRRAGVGSALPVAVMALSPEDSIIEEQGMRVVDRRRGGWNDDAPPLPRSAGAKIHERAVRMSPFTRKLGAALLITLLAMVIFAACFVAFRTIDSKQISVPAALTRVHRSTPLQPSAPASTITPLPPVHNSPDTECDDHRQCTDEEFAGLMDSLGRQWAITPEELRSGCAGFTTYPSLEHCILSKSVPWMDKHPKEAAPWINPKNFDTAIMALCQKDPKSLSLCLKP